MPETVTREDAGGVATITMLRPGLTHQSRRELLDIVREVAADGSVRAVVLTGTGRAFCVGQDLGQHVEALRGDAATSLSVVEEEYNPLVLALAGLRVPVVVAVNGACAGAGLGIALAGDLRVAAAGAKFTTAFARRGLVAEHGMSWALPRLVGPAHAMDLLLSGRVVVAEEALELGLVNRVCAPDRLLDETLAYAEDLAANCSPASMAAMKGQVYRDLQRGLDESVEDANRLMLESFARPDFAEGVQSFVERREPSFAPLD